MAARQLSPLKIAHISDLHFRIHIPGPPSLPERKGRELAGLFSSLQNKIQELGAHVLAVTGDLVDVPRWMLKDWAYYDWDKNYWEACVRRDYKELLNVFNALGIPVLVTPGNHDHPYIFKEVFKDYSKAVEINGFQFFAFWDWNHRGSVARRFDKERKLFDRAMEDDKRPQVHLQHYVTEPNIKSAYPFNYMEREELSQRIKNHSQVKLVLSGHYHSGAEFIVERKPEDKLKFFTAKAFCEGGFPYYLHSWEENVFVTKEFFVKDVLTSEKRKAVFLDRDGVLTADAAYYSGPNEIRLVENCGRALKELRDKGFVLVVITNQTSVGLGYTSKDIVNQTHDVMSKMLMESGAGVDGIYYGTGAGEKAVLPEFKHRKNCKPSPNMLLQAAKDFNIDVSQSFMVGDRLVDCQAAEAAKVKPILVRTGMGKDFEKSPDLPKGARVFENIFEFAVSL